MSALKQTPLIGEHERLQARLVDFGGWQMPLHYGSQLDEHHAVRRNAGTFDVSHMLAIDLRGVATRPFLRYLLANDVAKLKLPGKALYSCMLNDRGGVVDDLIVYRFDDRHFRVVVNAGTADKDLTWIERQRAAFGGDVDITPRHDCALLAVQGPRALERLGAAYSAMGDAAAKLKPFQGIDLPRGGFVARTGYTGEDGVELMLPAVDAVDVWRRLLDAGIAPCGLGARDTLRLEAGMNLYGQDMDESVTPLEAGIAWTVDRSNQREFIGRSALDAQQPTAQLIGLVLIDKGILRSHQAVRTRLGDGVTTSGSYAPTLAASIALGRVPAGIAVGEIAKVQIRDKWLAARVVNSPFVRNGKALVALG